ncbi:TPR domain-containing protein [Patellaria atrata CBS 101060]|uniref:TPR domain-containing protein n=1 Tax=Patellaria atrata CBS 101060 TaxID=1346257 RepID=A0A9P4VUH0_9PEZI|nr:TPR domain-containing protein [Patellaria atrata CBS 101060]
MADPNISKKRLALAILDFLSSSVKDGTVNAEDAESMEIASNCIAEAFKVDPNDKAALTDAVGTQNLLTIYGVYEKLKGKGTSPVQASKAPTGPNAGSSTAASEKEFKEKAENLKGLGNAAMQKKDYKTAIDFYTQALDLVPLNPIFLSNRAAAYSGALQHEEAKQDAEMAVAADPKYTKAWSRLGLAKFALGDAKGAMDAYKQGIDAEGNGGSEAMKRGYEMAKRRVEEEGGSAEDVDDIAPSTRGGPGAGGMPDLANLASMLGGGGAGTGAGAGAPGGGGAGAGGMPDLAGLASMLGGGGGGGGMPDIAQMMQNPMMRQMAQNLMSNPDALNNILQNPRMREMAERFGGGAGAGAGAGRGAGGGGMPDLSSLMNDPSIADLARNFMGGAGRGQ